jgi:inositol-hexakisphosphate/diphosphoinositol-pentakisphosphate 1-kinase
LGVQVTHQAFLDLFQKYKDAKGKQAKLKAPDELEAFLRVVQEVERHVCHETIVQESHGGSVPMAKRTGTPDNSTSGESASKLNSQLRIIRNVLEHGNHFSGINRKVQLKPCAYRDPKQPSKVSELQVIVKWGGVLTHLGRRQAHELGYVYRMVMYPRSADGCGLLRLHSTYRHDLKIYSSDEGRVQTSAAAFAKGLLDLEGESLVCSHPCISNNYHLH